MAEAPDTLAPARLDAVGWIILGAILALSVLAGVTRVSVWAGTWIAALLFPPAAGLPELWPPLRVMPIGETTLIVWLIDLAGVAVMLCVAWLQLRAVTSKRPAPGPGRALGRGIWTTIVAFLAGNLVRGVLQSFVLHSDLGTYAGQLAANLVVTFLLGAVAGVLVGLLTMLGVIVTRPASSRR